MRQKKAQKRFIEAFSHLTDEFGPVPWWCWTGRMNKKDIRHQLLDMKEKGVKEFFIVALYGLEFPSFLKDSYWDYIGYLLKQCQQAGMKVWFYDDLNWPSGTAAGYLLKEHPEYRSFSMRLKETTVLNGETVDIASFVLKPTDILYAGVRNAEGKITDIEIDKKLWSKDSNKKMWTNDTGGKATFMILLKEPFDTVLFSSIGTADSWQQHGYGDMLNKTAVETWMSYIHRQYLKRFRRYFGSTIRGFFFDEPYANKNSNISFALTKGLFHEFNTHYGYKLEDSFSLLLSENTERQTLKVRIDFYRLITDLFSKNFAKTLGQWCKNNKVLLTGHCMAEESISFSNKVTGDIHEFIKWLQVPGMDMLAGCMPGKALQTSIGKLPYDYPLLMLTAKRVSSTARYTGAARTMCEAFGVRDWNCTLEQQKKDTDWLVSMGISLINDNALIYSISDFRKRAIAGKHFTQPWWQYYRIYADYCRRVSFFASFAPLDADIAVFYSATSAYAATTFRVGTECRLWNETAQSQLMLEMLVLSMNALFENHLDFEMLFEDVLQEATISKGVLKCRNAEFRVIVVPGCFVVNHTSAEQLKKFSESGGKVIWLGSVPDWTYDGTKLASYQKVKKDRFIAGINCDKGRAKKALVDEILPSIVRKWEIVNTQETKGIWATARYKGSEYMIFLANHTSRDENIILRHRLKGPVVIMDVDDGSIYKAQNPIDEDTTSINLDIRQGQSFIVHIGEELPCSDIKPGKGPATSDFSGEKIILDDNWDFTLEGENHYLPEIFVKNDPMMKGKKEKWYIKPADETWQDTFYGKLTYGFTLEEAPYYWVRGTFNLIFKPDSLSFIVDTQDWQKLYLNGQEAPKPQMTSLWDKNNMVFKVATLCKEGRNEFAFLVKSSFWRSWTRDIPGFQQKDFIEPVVISGNFIVKEKNGKSVLFPPVRNIKNNGWNIAGYPYFSGTGIYRQTLELKNVLQSPRLVIESAFTAVKVRINGKEVGIKVWKPYVFDLEGFLKKGTNEIEIHVTNSLGNILRRVYGGNLSSEQKGGITGQVYILHSL